MKIQAALAGRYELDTVVGIGPHGTVWRARTVATEVVRVVKILERQYAADDLIVGRFVRERRSLETPVHAAWVFVRELLVADEGLALVTDHVDGNDLGAQLSRSGPLTVDQAITVALACADALAAAHGQGVVHGNLKPANILVGDPDHAVRITDARLSWLTRQAPGGAHAPGEPTPQTDIFQLGAVLYEMLSGRSLPGGGPPPLLPDSVDSVLAPIVHACLAERPENRPYAAELAVALRELPVTGGGNRLVRRYITDEWVPPGGPPAAFEQLPVRRGSDPPGEAHAPAAIESLGWPGQPPAGWQTEPSATAGQPERAAGPPAVSPPRSPAAIERGPATSTHRRDRAHRRPLLVALVAVLVLVVVGVVTAVLRTGGDNPTAAQPATGRVSTAVETPAAPAQAAAQTTAGATAFVPYWFATLNYALATGNTEPFRTASGSGCTTCTAAAGKIAGIYGGGGAITGAAYVVRSVKADSFLTLDRPILRVVIDRSPGVVVGPSDRTGDELTRLTFSSCQIVLTWSNSGWTTVDAQTSGPLA